MSKEPKIAGVIKEAIASVKLDGDTMDCEKCKAVQKQKLIEKIENLFKFELNDLIGIHANRVEWQQFKKGK